MVIEGDLQPGLINGPMEPPLARQPSDLKGEDRPDAFGDDIRATERNLGKDIEIKTINAVTYANNQGRLFTSFSHFCSHSVPLKCQDLHS